MTGAVTATTAAPASRPVPSGGTQDGERSGGRRATITVWLVAFAVLLADRPGQMFFESKLGVDIDPAGFLARLWHLWDPLQWFGTLQDQYIGYAFPMGPFYLITHALGIPVWIAERLWLSLLVAAGFWGLVKLAAALGIGSPRSRVVAGLVFALTPSFTMIIGSTSAGVIGGLLAPWAVLPLVRAIRQGSVIRPAALSGVAVLCMGGVNATVTLEALVLPALFIVTQATGRQRLRLGGAWILAVALATAWWAIPLLLQARYSFNFLPYIEQSATTTATMSAATFLRGAGEWTGYLNFGSPWLTAGWDMVTNSFAIVAASIMAGLGLAGIASRELPVARWLRISLAVAALGALAGYPGSLGGPFHGLAGELLNGALAPFRNVYKLEPVAAAVLALGIAHLTRQWWRSAERWSAARVRQAAAVLGAIVVLAGLGYPYLVGQVLNPGSFRRVPGYWYQVSAFLGRNSPRAPALVVPADSHGTYMWGEPIDEPLEPLARSPWVERGLVPYGGAGSQLLLNSLEGALEAGEPVPGLAAVLARSGIGYVVVRNDLDPQQLGYVPPQRVRASLLRSGFRRVAAFGPKVLTGQTAATAVPAVEVFAASESARPPSAVAVLPVASTVLVNGGPDGLLQLAGQGLLRPDEPAVVAGDPLARQPARWLVTDSLRRADHAFGQVSPGESYTYTAAGVNPPDDPLGAGGMPPRQLLPVAAAGHQTVAVLSGAAAVTASSAGSWLNESARADPVGAFDGNPATAWVEASPVTPVGQWVQVTFRRPVVLSAGVRIALLDDNAGRAIASRLEVTTAAGTVVSAVHPDGRVQPLAVPAGASRWLRITIESVSGGFAGGPGAGISDVLIPGVQVTRYLQVPEAAAGRQAPSLAFSFSQPLPSPASLGDPAGYQPLARVFDLPQPSSLRLRATAVALPGHALNALLTALTPVGKNQVEVTASSTWSALPTEAAASLLGKGGGWLAGGRGATLHLTWHGARTIRYLVLTPLRGLGAAPQTVKITSPAGVRWATVGIGGLTTIEPPLRASEITISFPVVQYATSAAEFASQAPLPVGLARLTIPALKGLRVTVPGLARRFALSCGRGPVLTLDGRRYATAVSGTAGDLEGFRPVPVRLCAPGPTLDLSSGRHWLATTAASPFAITGLSLTSAGAATGTGLASLPSSVTGPASRVAKITMWQPDARRVLVGPGPAAYLELHQNANIGWQAVLDGRPLRAVRLDGWQQGFVLPAGQGGTVVLSFAPAATYHFCLVAGAIGIVLLAFAAAWWPRRRKDSTAAQPTSASPSAGHPDVAPDVTTRGSPPRRWLAIKLAGISLSAWAELLALCGLIALIGGVAVVVVPLAVVARWRWPVAAQAAACGAVLVAGALTVLAASPISPGTGAFGAPAQGFALLGLAIALSPAGASARPTAPLEPAPSEPAPAEPAP